MIGAPQGAADVLGVVLGAVILLGAHAVEGQDDLGVGQVVAYRVERLLEDLGVRVRRDR